MMYFKAKEGQDKWVLEKLNHLEGGYFVDIGAHNGLDNSNTYVLEKLYKWNGICVEPNPCLRSFPSLIKNRNCVCENVCIFSENTTLPFVARGRHPEQSGIVGKFANDSIHKMVKKGHQISMLQAITLNDLLKKNNAPPIIDYLSLDTEGSEWEILKAFNFDNYKIRLITVEHNYFEGTKFPPLEKEKKDKIKTLLENKGFVLDKTIEADDWYYRLDV